MKKVPEKISNTYRQPAHEAFPHVCQSPSLTDGDEQNEIRLLYNQYRQALAAQWLDAMKFAQHEYRYTQENINNATWAEIDRFFYEGGITDVKSYSDAFPNQFGYDEIPANNVGLRKISFRGALEADISKPSVLKYPILGYGDPTIQYTTHVVGQGYHSSFFKVCIPPWLLDTAGDYRIGRHILRDLPIGMMPVDNALAGHDVLLKRQRAFREYVTFLSDLTTIYDVLITSIGGYEKQDPKKRSAQTGIVYSSRSSRSAVGRDFMFNELDHLIYKLVGKHAGYRTFFHTHERIFVDNYITAFDVIKLIITDMRTFNLDQVLDTIHRFLFQKVQIPNLVLNKKYADFYGIRYQDSTVMQRYPFRPQMKIAEIPAVANFSNLAILRSEGRGIANPHQGTNLERGLQSIAMAYNSQDYESKAWLSCPEGHIVPFTMQSIVQYLPLLFPNRYSMNNLGRVTKKC